MRFVYPNEKNSQSKAKTINLSPAKIKRAVLWSVLGIVALIAIFTCFFTTNEQEQAVITTFGKVTSVVEKSGFHLKLPFGIQHVEKVPVNINQKIELNTRKNKKIRNSLFTELNKKFLTNLYICVKRFSIKTAYILLLWL